MQEAARPPWRDMYKTHVSDMAIGRVKGRHVSHSTLSPRPLALVPSFRVCFVLEPYQALHWCQQTVQTFVVMRKQTRRRNKFRRTEETKNIV